MNRREQDREQGELYRGFGDTLSRALELALTPTIFGGLGWLLDRWAGTSPAFTLVFFLLAVVGMFARMYYGYDSRMRAHEAAAPWIQRSGGPSGNVINRPRPPATERRSEHGAQSRGSNPGSRTSSR